MLAAGAYTEYIKLYMKQILLEIDDRLAKDLEHVAPAKKRMRANFLRLAIQQAIDLTLDRKTEEAYRAYPMSGGDPSEDLVGWDAGNKLAVRTPSESRPKKPHRRAV